MKTTTKSLIAIAALAVIGIPIALHLSPERPPLNEAAPVVKEKSTPGPRRYRPAPVTEETRQTVDGILQRHHGMTMEELQRSPELNLLMDRFIAALGTPAIEAKMEQHLAAMPPEAISQQSMLKIDLRSLEDAQGRAWLEAAVSNDPQKIEDWILSTLDNAIFEFTFDPELERTSNGVSLQR